jgi:hypothetical protein
MKRQPRQCLVLALVALSLVLGVPALGSPFVNPPEQSGYPWSTPFPYQRNILWDFTVNPVGGPTPNGTPGAHYEGYLDPLLRRSDFVQFSGGFTWFNTLAISGVDVIGAIGIDNRQGTGDLSGTATFHLDNKNDPLFKHVWIEWVGSQTANVANPVTLVAPPGYTSSGLTLVKTEPVGSQFRQNLWGQIIPNPLWEEIVFNITVPVGTYWYLDAFHVATECVPEPGTIMLGLSAVGLLSVVSIRRGFRK